MFIIGVVGDLLTIVVFLSLKTFRDNSCSFYLLLMSIFNIINLCWGLLSRILMTGFGIDWTLTSSLYCSFRWFCLYIGILSSFTMISLATIDQYLSTCSSRRCQGWSNIRTAHRLSLIMIVIWIVHAIPSLIYFHLIKQSSTNEMICTSINPKHFFYHIYIYNLILAGVLPITITILFGSLAYRNIQQLTHRTLPIIRRQLDQQLTIMVLVQVIHNFFVTIPYVILMGIIYTSVLPNDPIVTSQIQFSQIVSIYLYYLNYAVRNCFI